MSYEGVGISSDAKGGGGVAWGGRVSGWLNDLGHGTSSEYVDSLLVTRWKADACVVPTPPPALPTLSLAHTLTSGTARARLARTLFTWSGGAEGAISLPAAP